MISSTNGFLSDGSTQHAYDASGTIHSTLVLGANAYGVTDIAAQSPYSPKVMIADGADKSDPLNQLTKISYKSYYASAVLQPKYYVEMYSKTAFA